MLFPFSLRDKAMVWFTAAGGYAMETFDELIQEFIAKFFPPSKMEKLRMKVHQFRQQPDESFRDA